MITHQALSVFLNATNPLASSNISNVEWSTERVLETSQLACEHLKKLGPSTLEKHMHTCALPTSIFELCKVQPSSWRRLENCPCRLKYRNQHSGCPRFESNRYPP